MCQCSQCRLLFYVLLASQSVQLSIMSLTMTRPDERILQIIFEVMCHIAWYGKELTECLWYCYMKQSMFATPRRIFGDDFHPRKTLCYCYCCFYCRFATPERILADHFQWTLVSSDWWYNLGAKNGMQCLTDKAPVWWEWEFRFSPFLSEITFAALSC